MYARKVLQHSQALPTVKVKRGVISQLWTYLATSTCSMLQETPCLSVSCFVDGVDGGVGRGRVVLYKVIDVGGEMLIVDVYSQKRILARQ